MTGPFGLIRTPRIYFGAGESKKLPGVLGSRGKDVLLITGKSSFLDNRGITELMTLLDREKFTLHHERIGNEPAPEDVDRIVDRYRDMEVQAVVAVGGGSAMDAGKAVSAMLPLELSVKEYLEGVGTRSHPGVKRFFVALPTTSGTGSEATANAVLSGSDERGGFKRSLRHENLVPDVALVDPSLTLGCPRNITAAGGMDAFTQLMESYLSLKAGPLTDSLALDGIRHVHHNLAEVCKNGDNPEARKGMAYAALLSGITLANAGLGLVHGFASSLGAEHDIPHGVICGTLMAVVNRFNIRALLRRNEPDATTAKYVTLGKIFSGREGREDTWYMEFVAQYLDALTETLGIARLGDYGVPASGLGKIASATDHKSNPVRFEKEQLVEMLRERI